MLKALTKKKEFVVLLIVIALAIVVTIVNPAFVRPNNIFDFLRSNSMYGIMAFGMLPILITGGIDLSVSSTICLTAVLQGVYLQHTTNHSVVLIFLICIGAGAAVGLIPQCGHAAPVNCFPQALQIILFPPKPRLCAPVPLPSVCLLKVHIIAAAAAAVYLVSRSFFQLIRDVKVACPRMGIILRIHQFVRISVPSVQLYIRV